MEHDPKSPPEEKNSREKISDEKIHKSIVEQSLENENVRRGIELGHRILESRFGKTISKNFAWWRGGRLNKNSLLLLAILFVLNLVIVWPLFMRDLTNGFSSSALTLLAGMFEYIRIFSKSQFFSLLAIFFIAFAPISMYLFMRKIVLRHDLIAFIATLFFIAPIPIIKSGSPLVDAMMNGDGAHVIAFSIIPFLLLFFQSYIVLGMRMVGKFTIICTTIIAIISPFAVFNLIILFLVITIAEGFLGKFRVRASRMMYIIIQSFLLSLFWYLSNFLTKIVYMEDFRTTIAKIWSIFPISIPILPVSAIIFFLIFDRREKLKPIFIAVSLFILYTALSYISTSLSIAGLFSAQRYVIEVNFSRALLFSLGSILLGEFLVRKYIFQAGSKIKVYGFICAILVVIIGYIILTVIGIRNIHGEISLQKITTPYSMGVGSMKNIFDINILSILGGVISVATLLHLFGVIKRFPLKPQKKHEIEKSFE